jgi:hypothetical protein
MLAGIPRLPSRLPSTKATRLANAVCKATGTMTAPCMAPLMKRRARGHLRIHVLALGHRPNRSYQVTFEVCAGCYARRELFFFDGDAFERQICCPEPLPRGHYNLAKIVDINFLSTRHAMLIYLGCRRRTYRCDGMAYGLKSAGSIEETKMKSLSVPNR